MKFKILPSVIIVLTASVVLGWIVLQNNSQESNSMSLNETKVTPISPQEFDELANNPKAYVLDVHIPEQVHIPGTDSFIPFDQIKKNTDKLPQDKTTPILVYCRSGSMSKEASQELVELGYTSVYDLTGGINAYKETLSEIALTPLTQDLKTVIYGEIAQTSFILTNFTASSMEITRISTSCGCTKAKAEKEKLGPYEETTINVSFNPAVHKDDIHLGNVTKTIYIETDNSDFSRLTADITANIVKQ